ncbi:MAG: hypothetical protein O2890_00320 [Cyanobacteria bacterium]|nr:hypothetical protein [Cyanobacteriota bacterium]
MSESPETPRDRPSLILPTGPGFALTGLYYFSGSALVSMLLAAKTFGIGMSGVSGELALAVGAVGGLLGGFYNHTMTMEVPFTNRKTFLRSLEPTLGEMGYALATESDGVRVYQRDTIRQLFSGKIYLQCQDGVATLASRAIHIRTLQKRLSHSSRQSG